MPLTGLTLRGTDNPIGSVWLNEEHTVDLLNHSHDGGLILHDTPNVQTKYRSQKANKMYDRSQRTHRVSITHGVKGMPDTTYKLGVEDAFVGLFMYMIIGYQSDRTDTYNPDSLLAQTV